MKSIAAQRVSVQDRSGTGIRRLSWIQTANQVLAAAIPNARREVLTGADHEVLHEPELLASLLLDFFA
ncbi:hypothetical protein [Nocardia inohanensis]|uniref:hypothetical protein n=1 Tax=Nocardia inohanensis TaxID=209246 RepID=UPI0008360539|nr:hypothetical protein [Nocardia inohanensis]